MKRADRYSKRCKARAFSCLEEENAEEYRRLAGLTPHQRLDEFAVIQARTWGTKWTKEPMKKVASIETVAWLKDE